MRYDSPSSATPATDTRPVINSSSSARNSSSNSALSRSSAAILRVAGANDLHNFALLVQRGLRNQYAVDSLGVDVELAVCRIPRTPGKVGTTSWRRCIELLRTCGNKVSGFNLARIR